MPKTISAKGGLKIPVLGFGTWQLQGRNCYDSVLQALETGYRHIDTADAYDNHPQVAKAIKTSGLKRGNIFLTTKVWRDELGKTQLQEAAKRFLEELQTEYLDLLLIHWPNRDIAIGETLQGMRALQDQGLIRSFGVSNFTIHHLQEALETGIEFITDQVELHPSLQQNAFQDFCRKNNIIITAYSPIAQGEDLQLPIIQQLAQKYDRSPSQVVFNWLICQGMVAIPRSSNPKHIEDNFKALEFELSQADLNQINTLDQQNRLVNPSFSDFNY